MENQVITEYLAITNSNANDKYDDKWDESKWSDEPKSGCWGDW